MNKHPDEHYAHVDELPHDLTKPPLAAESQQLKSEGLNYFAICLGACLIAALILSPVRDMEAIGFAIGITVAFLLTLWWSEDEARRGQ